MDYFTEKAGQLYAEQTLVTDLAKVYGTPCYIYSRATLERHWHAYNDALGSYPHLVCYAVKANSNLAVLNCLARLGSGFDIVSQGELERVLTAGGSADKIVFSGVGKQVQEMERALEIGIYCFNVESETELIRLNAIAQHHNVTAPISIRVNPDVNPHTHSYISTGLKENKFGIASQNALAVYQHAMDLSHLSITGIDCHIGSQLLSLAPLLEAFDHVLQLIEALRAQGIELQHINLGGGLGVRYSNENPPHPKTYIQQILSYLTASNLSLILEPGRAIAANAGILVSQVKYIKHHQQKNFAIVDAAMNDLLRPALYGAKQTIVPVQQHTNRGYRNI